MKLDARNLLFNGFTQEIWHKLVASVVLCLNQTESRLQSPKSVKRTKQQQKSRKYKKTNKQTNKIKKIPFNNEVIFFLFAVIYSLAYKDLNYDHMIFGEQHVAHVKRSMCCTSFAHDCARATKAYVFFSSWRSEKTVKNLELRVKLNS